MAMLQAMRHHIRRAHVKWAPAGFSADCEAEMLAEDEALERRLDNQADRIDRLTPLLELPDALDTLRAKINVPYETAHEMRMNLENALEDYQRAIEARLVTFEARIQTLADRVFELEESDRHRSKAGALELTVEDLEERFEAYRVEVSDRIDHVQQQVDTPEWRDRR